MLTLRPLVNSYGSSERSPGLSNRRIILLDPEDSCTVLLRNRYTQRHIAQDLNQITTVFDEKHSDCKKSLLDILLSCNKGFVGAQTVM